MADLVAVEGRPHELIDGIERIRAVYLGGREVDRALLLAAEAGGEYFS